MFLFYSTFKTLAPFTKPIWSGPNPYPTTVQTKFGYVNGTFRYQKFRTWVQNKVGPAHVQGPWSDRSWSSTKSGCVNALNHWTRPKLMFDIWGEKSE